MKRTVVLALASALCLATLRAEGAPVSPKPVRVFLSLSGDDPNAVADANASLGAALASSPGVLAVYVAGSSADDSSGAALCRLFLDVRLKRTDEGEAATWEIRSLADGPTLSSGEATRDSSVPAWSDASFWRPLVEGILPALAAIPADTIVVGAKPGTRVSGFGEDFVVSQSGEIEVPVDVPSLYAWSAKTAGAFPERGTLYVREGGIRLEIPYRPLWTMKRWSLDASLFDAAFPEARASYSPSPSWFVRATITQFAFGLSLSNAGGKSYPPLVYSTGLVQPGAGAGWYPFGGNGSLRLYLGLDAFLRVIFPTGGMAIEPIAPFGISPTVGIEWLSSGTMGVFLELGATIYPIADYGFMIAAAGENSGRLLFGGATLFPGHGWFGDFPDPRFGMRFKL